MSNKLKIHRLKIEVFAHQIGQTNSQKFEASFQFEDGINIIHANNTMGKSTCINSIIYVLGLEMLLGKKGIQGLTNSLWGKIEFNGVEHEVDKSVISLEISNSKNVKIKIIRSVTDPNEDSRLVRVIKESGEEEKYFVHDPGAVQSTKGFHHFLAEFIDWNLPAVTTFEGGKVPLYPECIFPLFFIEQKKGWSKLQATIPTIYKIKNPATQAIQFVLKLDVGSLNLEKEELKAQLDKASADWSAISNGAHAIIEKMGGVLQGLPEKPVLASEKLQLEVKFFRNEKMIDLEEWVHTENIEIAALKEGIESNTYNSNAAEKTLNDLEDALVSKETSLERTKTEFALERQSLEFIEKRIETIDEDIKKNQETLKIQKYANEIDNSAAFETCPSCGQGMKNTLLPPSVDEEPMSIEDNITYLKEQRASAIILRDQTLANSELQISLINSIETELKGMRQKVRDMKMELRQDIRIPKISQIRELAIRESRLQEVERGLSDFESVKVQIQNFSEDYEKKYLRYKDIANTLISENDKAKLTLLQSALRSNLRDFEFKTVNPLEIEVSPYTYEPTADGIQLYTNASASDSIRLIAAYTLSLLDISQQTAGNHIGMLIFDELKQQDIDSSSINGIYKKMQSFGKGAQFIVTSSAAPSHLEEMTQGVSYNRIEFSNKLIAPVQ